MRPRESPQDSAQSETPHMLGNSTRENRETPATPVGEDAAGRLEKALSPTSNMHVAGESDGRTVPAKCPNNGEQAPAEGMEGRRPTKENIGQTTPPRVTKARTAAFTRPTRTEPKPGFLPTRHLPSFGARASIGRSR